MAELSTIARPYAKAAFEFALEHGQLAQWSGMLQFAATVALHGEVRELLGNPRFTSEQAAELFTDLLGDQADEHGKNFLRLLADNGRLAALPDVAALYEVQRSEYEKSVAVTVEAAAELTSEAKAKLADKLEARLQRKVKISYDINPELLGGFIVRAGDMVIDGSVRGKLTQLGDALRA